MSDPKENPGKPARKGKKKRKIVRRLIILVVVLGILGLGGYIVVRKLQADYRVEYDPYTASVGSISNSLSYSGTMQLINSQTCTADSECRVRELYVAAGQKVKEGDRLIRLSDGTTLKAEFDGTVSRVDVQKDDEVRSGTTLLQVSDFDRMKVSFRVGENNIRDVQTGQDIRIKVASIDANFIAKIDSIDYGTYSGNNVAYYTATAAVDTSSVDSVYPGMQATITITQEEARDVVILKMDAISTAADNSAFVWKQEEDGTMTEQAVTVGVSNGNYVEIKSGVAGGETVYAVREKEETTMSGILAGIFGSQQVNRPSGRGSGSGGSGFPSGDFSQGSGGSGNPGGRNRGN